MRNRGKLLFLQLGALSSAAIMVNRPATDDPVNWHDLAGWLQNATPETVVAETGRLLLIGVAGWLAVITALAWCTFLSGTFHSVARITPRFVRRLVEGAFAASLVATALAPAAASAADRPRFVPVAPVRDGRNAAESQVLTLVPELESAPAVRSSPDPAPPEPAPADSSTTPVPTRSAPFVTSSALAPAGIHVVQRGESLWSIAHDASAGRPADQSADAYWHALCDANRGRLPSGDVNLVFPGDEVVLP